jgi:hypothetical protein
MMSSKLAAAMGIAFALVSARAFAAEMKQPQGKAAPAKQPRARKAAEPKRAHKSKVAKASEDYQQLG